MFWLGCHREAGCTWLRTRTALPRFESSVPARRRAGNAMPAKKKPNARRVRSGSADLDTLRSEYDFRDGVRGKYVGRYREGSLVVILDPDVAEAYPSSVAVNNALRRLLDSPSRGARRKRRV